MKDPFGRGIFAGSIGVIVINLVEYLLAYLQISETPLWVAGGLVFLSEKALATPLEIFIGVLSNVFVAIVVGIAISYYIFFSGTDFAVLKGVGISLIVLFLAQGVIFPMRELAPEIKDSPSDVLAAFIDHTVFGALSGYVIKCTHEKKFSTE